MTSVHMPALGESVDEGTVLVWLKQVGETVAIEEPLLEVATDKVDTEIPSPVAGVLREILAETGEVIEVGAAIAIIDTGTTDPQQAPDGHRADESTRPERPSVRTRAAVKTAKASGFLSPLVRELSRQHNLQLDGVAGTGAGGRIRKLDVLDLVEASVAADSAQPSVTPDGRNERREPMTRVRRAIASAMMSSLHTSAQLTTVVEVDVTNVARARDQQKKAFLAHTGVALSYLPFFARAAVTALADHLLINARIDHDDIVYASRVNLGIAVDSDRGLFVPVIRDAVDLNIQGLAKAIADAAERTRSNKLSADDLTGGTFTITNTGSRGALFDTPIISAPQSAILGTGAVVERPVVTKMTDGSKAIAIRSMVYFALSYDHQIVDGAAAAAYLTAVKKSLESDSWVGQL